MQHLKPAELAQWLAEGAAETRPLPLLLDVREAWEVDICKLPGSQNIPMQTLPLHLESLDATKETVVICHHGVRSMQVVMYLERQGFSALYNLRGGVAAWAEEVDPDFPCY